MMCGGFGAAKVADENIVSMCNEIRTKVEAEVNALFALFEPVEYKSQVVAGTNYNIKVRVDQDKHIRVKIHKPLQCNGSELVLMEVDVNDTTV